MKKLIDGVIVDCTPEEIAEMEAEGAAYEAELQQKSQDAAISAIKKVRDDGKLAPITVGLNTFDLDKEAQTNINNTIESYESARAEAILLGWPDDGTVPWVLADNSTVPVVLADLQAVKDAGVARGTRLHMEYGAAKSALQV